MEQQVTPPKGKQDYSVGATVRIGGAFYRVTGHKPPPKKGEAAIIELVTHDLERRYEWQPFRGLRVIGGAPKRIRKKRAKGATKAQAMVKGPPANPPQALEKVSLWTRVVRAIRRH
jgi:hypothetical protein